MRFFPLEEIFQVHRPLQDLVQLLDVRHALGFRQREEFLIQYLVRHQHLVWRELIVERQRGPVGDAVRNGILVQIALVVLAAEGLEGPLAEGCLVHRRAGETDERRDQKSGHQEFPRSPPVVRCASSMST